MGKSIIGVVAAISTLMLATPAHADISEQDRQFLSALRSAGWTIRSADGLISLAHQVCNEGLQHGVSWQEMRSTLMSNGYSLSDSSELIKQSVITYCPSRDDVRAAIDVDMPSGAVTQDDLFVQQLKRNQRIIIDKAAAVDMAHTACRAPLAGPGLYDAQQFMKQRYPNYAQFIGVVMAHGVVTYCPDRLR